MALARLRCAVGRISFVMGVMELMFCGSTALFSHSFMLLDILTPDVLVLTMEYDVSRNLTNVC